MGYAILKPTKVHPKLRRLLFVCICGRASEEVLEVTPKAA
jgi:hypothetical protein